MLTNDIRDRRTVNPAHLREAHDGPRQLRESKGGREALRALREGGEGPEALGDRRGVSLLPGYPGDGLSAPKTFGGGSPRPANANDLIDDYNVEVDEEVMWTPNLGPFPIDIPGVDPRKLTATEAELLDELASDYGLLGLKKFQEITSNDPEDLGLAYATANEYFPRTDQNGNAIPGVDDGHNDAFRHAYWNALLTKNFGEDFAAAFASAHEGVPNNPADREAMDLYNNEVGRRIAAENPDASDEELAELVYDAVQNGETVVIDANGDLAYSDQVEVGQNGTADDPPAEGDETPPEYDTVSE